MFLHSLKLAVQRFPGGNQVLQYQGIYIAERLPAAPQLNGTLCCLTPFIKITKLLFDIVQELLSVEAAIAARCCWSNYLGLSPWAGQTWACRQHEKYAVICMY